MPRKNQVREGGSLTDFQSWKEIENACAAAALCSEVLLVSTEDPIEIDMLRD